MKQSFRTLLILCVVAFFSFRPADIFRYAEGEKNDYRLFHYGSINANTEFNLPNLNHQADPVTIRINCGGGNIILGDETWVSDTYFTGGSGYASASAISNTSNDPLYQSERFGNHSYTIPVPDGSYTVKLHFAEIFFEAGDSRLFNVNVENGQGQLSNYDVFVQAGGANAAKVETFGTINVSDGAVNISLTNVKDNAKISGIEVISNTPAGNTAPTIASPITDKSVTVNTPSLVIPLSSVFSDNNGFAGLTLTVSGNSNTALVNSAIISNGSLTLGFASGQTGTSTIKIKAADAEALFVEDEFVVQVNAVPATHIRINTGGTSVTFGSDTWVADTYFSNGSGYATASPIANTTLDALYQSERFGNHSYSIPVPNGTYTVKLHFAEIYFNASDARLFNVNIENGQATLSNYDVYLQAGGGNTAKIEQLNNITVNDGALNISFTSIKDNAKISAIEVISAAPAANTAPTVAAPVANQSLAYNTPSLAIPLANVFADNNGVANLTLSVSGNTNTTLVTSAQINSNTLNLSFASAQSGTSTIKIKATDAQGLFVEDEFNVTIQAPAANTAPTIASPITDKSVTVNTPSLVIPLSSVFSDNNGFAGLTLTVSGNSNTALVNSAVISSGSLTLGFMSGQTGTSTIKIKATDAEALFVEDEFIVQVNAVPAVVIRINAGGGSVAYGAETWNADQYHSGGSTYASSSAISSTEKDELYQSERWGSQSYNIPVPNGLYTLRLHFAEIFFSNPGQRVFNITIENGAASISNMDIVSRAGAANKAHIEEFNNLQVTDGLLSISFSNVVDNAKISAIEILSNASGGSNQNPVAVAGADVEITLPENAISLNGNNSYDPDGTLSSYSWSKQSGPEEFTIVNPNSQGTAINGLVAGTYSFRLTVTDNGGLTAYDDVTVVVNQSQGGSQTTTFIPLQSSWKYLDNGTNQGTNWRGTGFNDQAWLTGNGEFGYGDNDETTVVSYGGIPSSKYITTYFRKTITINNPSSFSNFSMNLIRDDGVVVYVNGNEVYRNNMPAGTISYTTPASSAASDDGNNLQSVTLPVTAFVNGSNVIAVEMHQSDQNSSDLSFDLQLIGNAGGTSGSAQILRGPYLQMGSSNAVTLRWRTDVPTDTKIGVGTSVGSYPLTASNSALTTEHEIRITGLNPDTKYFYSFGSSTQTLQAGAANFFRTAPPANTGRKIGFAAFGDCGRNENGFQSGTLSAYQNYIGSNPADLLLLLGDNAYDHGTEAEYTNNFFNVYSSNILKNHVLFPSPGNHDYDNVSQQSRSHEYYNAFTMPTNGESGGVASGTEAFYSYNWGNVHFLSLDSYGQEGAFRLYDTTGPQVNWIKNDLAANTHLWTVVYFHHPPYTMGSHNSDSENELVQLRQNFIRILERYGVDMVIAGHSHDYERSYLLKNHFGNESSFDINMHAVTSSTGKYDGSANSCPYITSPGHVNHGTVYIVAGSSGADGGVQNGYPHNALPFSVDDGGMFYFEVEGNRLDAKFLRRDGVIADQFTLMKNAGKTSTVNVVQGNSTTLTASWIGNYQWSNGATTRSITVSPNSGTTYTCFDPAGCISDIFQVTVNSGSRTINTTDASTAKSTDNGENDWKLYPVPVQRGQQLAITGSNTVRFTLQVINKEGKQVHTATASGTYLLETGNLSSGVYYIRIIADNKSITRKFMIID